MSNTWVLVISLSEGSFFEEISHRILATLRSKTTVQLARDPNSTVQLLAQQPSSILIADEALTQNKYSQIWGAVLQCIRQGSTAVVMGQFSSFVRPDNMKPFFSQAGLSWDRGSYTRTTLVLNQAATGDELATKLPKSYSQKALFVNNVVSSDMWYTTDESSVVESRVFGPTSVNTPGETPVAMARVGEGKLGYVGDVNAEVETDAVILAMCNLL
ncbi:uncharacterized protein N7503_010022 [Penicillium pulvis]|uniref:uncharacterized protein n=1 Tax=Penicillium pulvis TaxID=1562058 RepID=UPI0025489AE1|nr:uncharacterized protein N7503_010022 [Penicillium pulvis]KAJ5784810.1 hypothetical protein N7503_010022 [Penicillium pulvis]